MTAPRPDPPAAAPNAARPSAGAPIPGGRGEAADQPRSGEATAFPPGTFTPHPGRATAAAMLRAAAFQELRITLRNGEQLLLAFLIPIAALVALTLLTVGDLPEPRITTVVPGVLALALMSASFTSQAIITGFDRRYGVLKRLAATGFPRWLLLGAKCVATSVLVLAQCAVLCAIAAVALDWHPAGNAAWVILMAALGIAAFIGLALLLGGTMRAEAVLGIANLVWLALVGVGGVIIPLAQSPDWLRIAGGLTPAGALSNGLRAVLTDGGGPGVVNIVILGCWTLVGWAGTVRWLRWH